MFCKNGVLRNFAKFTRKHLCQRLCFNKLQVKVCNFIKKETVAQVFSREFCEISKNTFFHRTPPVSASELLKKCCFKLFQILQIEYIIYKKTKTCIANALNISLVSSAVIFLTTIEYGTSSSSIDSNEFFIWVFSRSIRRWLAGASNATGCSCNR